MKLVKCVNERTTYPGQITIGSRYYMDEDSIWKQDALKRQKKKMTFWIAFMKKVMVGWRRSLRH